MSDVSLTEIIVRAAEGPLDEFQAEAAFNEIMQGRATPVQIAALLVGLRARGAVPAEVAGGVRALRSAMIPVDTGGIPVIDTCGTGGGSITTFNISTAAALLASGLGVAVAKHGNRSFTSQCGSADVLEALGVRLDLSPEQQSRILREVGIIFMFAPGHHPAMRHVGPVRRELGMFTIMNLLGPLTNPAGARRQVVGVADPALLHLVAGALATLGHEHAMVVHGAPGMDELSPFGATRIVEVRDGTVREFEFDPALELGWRGFTTDELRGAEPHDNAAMVEKVLRGHVEGAARAAVLLNAAAALVVAGMSQDLASGVEEAERGLREGLGWSQLERLRAASLQDPPPSPTRP